MTTNTKPGKTPGQKKGKTPQDPIKIPSALLLKVRWPGLGACDEYERNGHDVGRLVLGCVEAVALFGEVRRVNLRLVRQDEL